MERKSHWDDPKNVGLPAGTPAIPFPVVKTVEEARVYLDRGCGVGIDCTGKTKEEAAAIMRLCYDYRVIGIRPRRTAVLYYAVEAKDESVSK